MRFPVFDLHCDTVDKLIGNDGVQAASLRHNTAHIDLDRAGELAGYAQCFACFTTYGLCDDVNALFRQKTETLLKQIRQNRDRIRQAFSADDIEVHAKDGLMSAVLTIEGPCGFGFDPSALAELYHIGFRITTLGWNEQNPLAGSHKTGGGLTDRGIAYVREAQRLGMVLDVSHLSDEGFWDCMRLTQGPVIASHSNSRSLCAHTRNITDDMFRAVCQTGGVVGVNLYTPFLGERATVDTVCDHIFHFLSLDPSGRHVALGGDLDGMDELPAGFHGIEDYPLLADRLLARGLDAKTVHRIFWDNAVEMLRTAQH